MKKRLSNNYIFLAGITLFLFSPLITLAVATPTNFKGVITVVVGILTAVLPVIVSLAVIYFLWGITQYIKADEGKKEEAKTVMVNGIIALFVMVSVWGFITILTNTFVPLTGTHTPPISDIISTDWSGTDTENPQ